MRSQIKKDILYVLNNAAKILEHKEAEGLERLKDLSNKTIHNASIYQDFDSLSISVIIYSISKMIERGIPKKDYQEIISLIVKLRDALNMNKLGNFNRYEKEFIFLIHDCDKKLNIYTQEIISKAKIKKGNRLFQHGLSSSRAADILGITKWELLNYLGKTREIEKHPVYGLKVEERLKKAFKVFGI